MAYTKEQCDREFREAMTKLLTNYGLEKLLEADEVFDVDAIIRYFLKKHPLTEYRTSGERGLAIEACLSEFSYALKAERLIELTSVLRSILRYTVGLFDRISECEEFRDEIINQLWMKPLPTEQPALLMCRAMIAAYDHARLACDRPLPSSEELIGRQKIREMLSRQPGATITRTEKGFTCIVSNKRNNEATNN